MAKCTAHVRQRRHRQARERIVHPFTPRGAPPMAPNRLLCAHRGAPLPSNVATDTVVVTPMCSHDIVTRQPRYDNACSSHNCQQGERRPHHTPLQQVLCPGGLPLPTHRLPASAFPHTPGGTPAWRTFCCFRVMIRTRVSTGATGRYERCRHSHARAAIAPTQLRGTTPC